MARLYETIEDIIYELTSKNVTSLKEWRIESPTSYACAHSYGWFTKIERALGLTRARRGYANKQITQEKVERLLAEKMYKTTQSWRTYGNYTYRWAKANGMFEEYCRRFDIKKIGIGKYERRRKKV